MKSIWAKTVKNPKINQLAGSISLAVVTFVLIPGCVLTDGFSKHASSPGDSEAEAQFVTQNSCTEPSIDSFRDTVHKIVTVNCASCHADGVNTFQFAVADPVQAYVVARKLVDLTTPDNSMLAQYAKNGHCPQCSGTMGTTILTQLDVWLPIEKISVACSSTPTVPSSVPTASPTVSPTPKVSVTPSSTPSSTPSPATPVVCSATIRQNAYLATVNGPYPLLRQRCTSCHDNGNGPTKFASATGGTAYSQAFGITSSNFSNMSGAFIYSQCSSGHKSACSKADAASLLTKMNYWGTYETSADCASMTAPK